MFQILMLSYLYGILHIRERVTQERLFEDQPEFTPFQAVNFLLNKLVLPKDIYYELNKKARSKAFTISKLTSKDAITRIKNALIKTAISGKSLRGFVEEAEKDEVLKRVGFHKENPYYWETVYRTNMSSAYSAGRWSEIQNHKEKIKYLKFIGIDDGRQSDICASVDGTILPADDPFWGKYTPPLHFNCRSIVIIILKAVAKVKKIKPVHRNNPDVADGFGVNPYYNWWKII